MVSNCGLGDIKRATNHGDASHPGGEVSIRITTGAWSKDCTVPIGRRQCPVGAADTAPRSLVSRSWRQGCLGARTLRRCSIGVWNAWIAKPHPLTP